MNKIEKIYTMEKDVEKEMILMVTGLIDKGLSKSGTHLYRLRCLMG